MGGLSFTDPKVQTRLRGVYFPARILCAEYRYARVLGAYHLSQNYYITARYSWTINFGRRNVKITSQKLSWNYFWVP